MSQVQDSPGVNNEILSNETATPQTNFGLYNIGSEMLWDRATAI